MFNPRVSLRGIIGILVFVPVLIFFQNCGSPMVAENIGTASPESPFESTPDPNSTPDLNQTPTPSPVLTPTPFPTPTPAATPPLGISATLGSVGSHGQVYYYLGGGKGVVLCFHGSGGSASGWTSGDKKAFVERLAALDYSFICPTSLDRSAKQWNSTNTSTNADVINVDGILNALAIPVSAPLYLVGHSNGGGFVSRYAVFSARKNSVAAAQYSNSSGIHQILSNSAYRIPSLFNFADCDPLVDASGVRKSMSLLSAKSPVVRQFGNDLDAVYSSGRYGSCHEFVDTADQSAAFFANE